MIPMTDTDIHTAGSTPAADPAESILPTPSAESRLRIVLRANAANSAVFGVLLATMPDAIDRLLETGHPAWLRVVGLALLAFGAGCAWLSITSLATMPSVSVKRILPPEKLAWIIMNFAQKPESGGMPPSEKAEMANKIAR